MQLLHTGPVLTAALDFTGAGDKTVVAAVTGKREVNVTPANVQIDDIFTLTIGNNSVSFTATAGTVGNVTAGLETAWNAAATPEFTPFTANDMSTYLQIIADAANVEFLKPLSATAVNGGANDTQTLTIADVADASPAKKILVLELHLYANAASAVRFESGAGGTALTGVMDMAADTQLSLPFNPAGHFETTAGALLNLELGDTSPDVAGFARYQLVL